MGVNQVTELWYTGTPRWGHEEEIDQSCKNVAKSLWAMHQIVLNFWPVFGQAGNMKALGIYRRNVSAIRIDIFDVELIGGPPGEVKLIAHNGAGYDLVGVHAGNGKGLWVFEYLIHPSQSTMLRATTALYVIISCLRHFSWEEPSIAQGTWKTPISSGLPHDLTGRTLGILGLWWDWCHWIRPSPACISDSDSLLVSSSTSKRYGKARRGEANLGDKEGQCHGQHRTR